MYQRTSLVIHHDDADPTAVVTEAAGCSISLFSPGYSTEIAFDDPGHARRWLEAAMDAINDAEKALARRLHPATEQAHEEREQYLEARYEAESEGALDYATTPRVMPS